MLCRFNNWVSLNDFGHSGHRYSLFRCVFTCLFKSQGYLYDRLQFPAKHLNLCLLWTILCCLSALLNVKVLPHFIHESLWLAWLFRCTFLALGLVNDFLQMLHTSSSDLCAMAWCKFHCHMLRKVRLQDAAMHLNQYLGFVRWIPWILTLKVVWLLVFCLSFDAFICCVWWFIYDSAVTIPVIPLIILLSI